jgi:predicted HD phosphohydrolase
MAEEHAIPPSQPAGARQPRRALLGLPLRALGTWLAARALAGCEPDADPLRPTAPAAPSMDSRSAAAGAAVPVVPGTRAASPAGAPQPVAPGTSGAASSPAACARPTTFAPIADDGLRTAATRTDQTSTLDWITMGISGAFNQATVPDTLLGLLRTLGDLRLGYPLSLLDHSLQAATRARRAGASDDLVLAALLHHVGMALSVEGYAELSAAIVRGYVSEDAYQIMRHHAEYAAAHYGVQTGEPTDQRARYANQPFHADAVRFADEWERLSYDPGYLSLPLAEFEPLIRERFATLTSELYTTHGDCI